MPFIVQKRRQKIADFGLSACVDFGDPCYVFYKYMVDEWKKEPRWTTAHKLYRDIVLDELSDVFLPRHNQLLARFDPMDIKAAADLAWQVFFQKYVMIYEDLKEKDNGTI